MLFIIICQISIRQYMKQLQLDTGYRRMCHIVYRIQHILLCLTGESENDMGNHRNFTGV